MIVKDVAPTGPIVALRYWLKKWRCGQGFHNPCPNGRQLSTDRYKTVCTACGEPMLRVGEEWLTGWVPPEHIQPAQDGGYRPRGFDPQPAYRTVLSYESRSRPSPDAMPPVELLQAARPARRRKGMA